MAGLVYLGYIQPEYQILNFKKTIFIHALRFAFLFSLFLTSCDSSIKEFNVGFSEGIRKGLKKNGCQEFKDKRKKWKNKSFKNGFIKGYESE